MEVKMVPIDSIVPYEKNPRYNDKAAQKVAESIKAYGFNSPIIVDAGGVIVCGHTRHKAAKILGMSEVPVYYASHLTPEQAQAYRIADNKTSDYSIWDNKLLLEELESIGEDLFTGFDMGSIEEELRMLEEKSKDNQPDMEIGTQYEIVFKSESMDRIEAIKKAWEEMEGGEEHEE